MPNENKITDYYGAPWAHPEQCVGDGWHPLVRSLIADLFDLGWDGRLHQIKEKFGGLRFYIGIAEDVVFDRIRKAEHESAVTCEMCGAPGKVHGEYWLKTLCEEHNNERKAQSRIVG